MASRTNHRQFAQNLALILEQQHLFPPPCMLRRKNRGCMWWYPSFIDSGSHINKHVQSLMSYAQSHELLMTTNDTYYIGHSANCATAPRPLHISRGPQIMGQYMALGQPNSKRWCQLDQTSNCKWNTGCSHQWILHLRTLLPKPVLRGICIRMQCRTWRRIWIVLGETHGSKCIQRCTARTHGSTPHSSLHQ